MLEHFLNTSLPSGGELTNSWMHVRANSVTSQNVNVLGTMDLHNNQITNLDISNKQADLASFRFDFTDQHNPPQSGEIYCDSDMLLLPNPQTLLVSKTSRLGHHFDMADWTSISVIDFHNSAIYQGTVDNFEDHATYQTVTVTFGLAIGEAVSVIGTTLELRYSSSTTTVDWADVQNKPDLEQKIYEWKYGGTYTALLPSPILSGRFYYYAEGHCMLFSTSDSNGYDHTDLIESLGASSQIIVITSKETRNRYVVQSVPRSDVGYREFQFNLGTSIIEDTELVIGTVYQISTIFIPSQNWTQITEKPIDIVDPILGQGLIYDGTSFKNSNLPNGESTDWSVITNKPTTFDPSVHTHVVADITNFPSTMTPSAHTHPWSQITSQPDSLESGFDKPENVIVSYDSATRKVTLTGSPWIAYWLGTEVPGLVSGWVSDAHTNANGTYFLYYNGSSFIWSNSVWSLDMLQIAMVSRTANYTLAIRECHGRMPWQVHQELHRTVGTYFVSGGDISGYVLSSTTATDRRPNISQAVIADEDLHTTLTALLKTDNTNAPYCWFYLSGSNGSRLLSGQTEICTNTNATTMLQYNLFSGGVWSLSNYTNGHYAKIFILALPITADSQSLAYRFAFIVPQQTSNSLSTIQAVDFSTISLGDLASLEYIPIAEIIVRQINGSTWSLISVAKITSTKALTSTATTGLTTVSTDSVTIYGNGTVVNPLKTIRLLPYTYGGTFVNPTPPTVISGNFYIDATNRYIIISKTDNLGNSHASGLALLDYGTQLTIQVANGKRNRYSLLELTSNQAGYVELSYGNSLSNIEDGTYVSNGDYEMVVQYNAISKIDHLADVYIDSGTLVDNQLLQYDSLLGWTNKTVAASSNKAFMSLGWFNDVVPSYTTSAQYYFSWSASGVTFSLVGNGFSVFGSQNTSSVINSLVTGNNCGVKNVSGVSKKLLVMGKCTGVSTAGTWISFGLNDQLGNQVRPARTQSWGILNEALSLHFHCVIDLANNGEIYLVGCVHSNVSAAFYLTNIYLTVSEI